MINFGILTRSGARIAVFAALAPLVQADRIDIERTESCPWSWTAGLASGTADEVTDSRPPWQMVTIFPTAPSLWARA